MARWGRHVSARTARRLVLAALGAGVLVVSQAVTGLSTGFAMPVVARAAPPAAHPNRFDPASAARPISWAEHYEGVQVNYSDAQRCGTSTSPTFQLRPSTGDHPSTRLPTD